MEETPSIDRSSDEHFLREALRQAHRAFRREEVPVGAVVVREGRILARAGNQVEELRDATAHAEILAITQASAAIGDWRLEGCAIYVTKEPCPMCAGAIALARIARLVYGAPDPRAGGAGGAFAITQHPGLNHRVETRGGVLAEECAALLRSFFAAKRAEGAD